ncbi:CarD family transcriptional regulator [Drancourtella sp. An177]|nr:CarD family transcriptional regulator [Drancourtella sp. An177]
MFKVGDFVVYGHNGVCEVKKIGTLETLTAEKDRMYYTLVPCRSKDSTVFAPVDGRKVPLRNVMTEKEALDLIDAMNGIAELQIREEKKREETYKEAIKTCDGKELVKLMKTIYRRKTRREAQGKKMTSADSRYFKAAQDALYNELAVSLQIPAEEVHEFIKEKLGK